MSEATDKPAPDAGTACEWLLHGRTVRGLSWGDPQRPPVLALHGWLDNAESFCELAPLMTDYYVVAPDLSGHGLTDHRSADASYQIWDDLPELVDIVDALGWQTFDLLGHSRGAIIGALLAATHPERVKHLVQLDAVLPPPTASADMVAQLRRFIDQRRDRLYEAPRLIEDSATALRRRVAGGLPQPGAQRVVTRNLRAVSGGFEWRTDPRLHGASAVKLNKEQQQSLLQALTMPVLVVVAEQGLMAEYAGSLQSQLELMPRGRRLTVAGGHHLHMEQAVAELWCHVKEFLQQ